MGSKPSTDLFAWKSKKHVIFAMRRSYPPAIQLQICNLLYRWNERNTWKSRRKTTARVDFCRRSLSRSPRSFLFTMSCYKRNFFVQRMQNYCLENRAPGTSGHIVTIVDFRSNFSCDNTWTGDSNSFLSVFSDGILLWPKFGKMSVKVHPFYLKPQIRWLALKVWGKSAIFHRHVNARGHFYKKHGAIHAVVRWRDVITIKFDSCGHRLTILFVWLAVHL